MRWQKLLAQGFHSAEALLQFLELPTHLGSPQSEQLFKTRVPKGFAERMTRGNPQDPLLLQVLAAKDEQLIDPAYTEDALTEKHFTKVPGLLHKYSSRVLLTVTGACAVHCRFCFRRHFPYENNRLNKENLQAIADYLADHSEVQEVILSGGDPLTASDATFKRLLDLLTPIPHLKILRIHSRIPVVLPERLTLPWLRLFQKSRFQNVMVLHANHPQELNQDVERACQKLKAHGFYLLNQSVILKNINNSVETLKQLSERLFEIGVLPYYLHVLDKVAGAKHFDIPQDTAQSLYQALQAQLPGYLVPTLVREVPGQPHKTRL